MFLFELASESIGGHGDDVMYGAVGGVFTVMMSCMGLLVVFTCSKLKNNSFLITRESVGDLVGLVVSKHSSVHVVHVAFLSGELRLHLLATSKPVSKAAERFSRDVRVLGPLFNFSFGDILLIVVLPSDEEVSVDLERLFVGHVELMAPPS